MKAAFEVIVVPVSDPEKSLRFYRDARTTEEMPERQKK
jgi:catechol 2,3-dioxygenase-like lactoylglutathione lyase family enzyme